MPQDAYLNEKRRQTALSVFGVVQYRKRVSQSAETGLNTELAKQSEPAEASTEATTQPDKVSVASSIQDLRAVAEELGDADRPAAKSAEGEARMEAVVDTGSSNDAGKEAAVSGSQTTDSIENGEPQRQFILRFWRCGNLLAVETAPEILNAGEEPEQPSVHAETKHRLANNVFRAIFGANAMGATMYRHHWPDEMGSNNAGDSAARGWLNLFLKGQKAKHPDTQLWLMGRDALELLLTDHGAPDELEGVRLQDNKLDLEIYVTPSLDAMVAKPYLKATAWKLLRTLASD